MTLLEALVEATQTQPITVTHARLAFFAFGDGETAYLSELENEDLLPLLEEWCAARRAEMGRVH